MSVKELLGSGSKPYKPEAIYLQDEHLNYDSQALTLQGKFSYNESPHLVSAENVLHNSDSLFIMDQAVYSFLMYFYEEKYRILFPKFDKLTDKLVNLSIQLNFKKPILKNEDPNTFTLKLINESTRPNKGPRYEFTCDISEGRHQGTATWQLCELLP